MIHVTVLKDILERDVQSQVRMYVHKCTSCCIQLYVAAAMYVPVMDCIQVPLCLIEIQI